MEVILFARRYNTSFLPSPFGVKALGRNINGSAHSGWSTVIVTGTLCTQPSGEVTVAVYTVVLVGLAIGFEIDELLNKSVGDHR